MSITFALATAVFALTGKDSQIHPKATQVDEQRPLMELWNGFTASTQQAARSMKYRLGEVELEDAERWLSQSGKEVKAWSERTASDIQHKFRQVDLHEMSDWLIRAGHNIQSKETWDGIRAVRPEDVSKHAKEYIRNNPWQTAFHVAMGFVFVAPGTVWTPLLYRLGSQGPGIRKGSPFAFIQSKIGPPFRRGIFAHGQSAGASGYGVHPLDKAIRGAIIVAYLAYGFSKVANSASRQAKL